MAPGFFSESRALYLQKTVRTDSPNVHKLDFLVPYFMVFVYKSQGPGGQSFNWLMHYKQVYIEICTFWLVISRRCSTKHYSIISKLCCCVSWLGQWQRGKLCTTIFSDCCGECKGDASSVLLRFVCCLIVNKILTLYMQKLHCNWLVLETMYNIKLINVIPLISRNFSSHPIITDSRYYRH